MFAILQNTGMESSHLGRPSLDISPTALPSSAESPPPPLIPYFKVEKEDDRESPAKVSDLENREKVSVEGVDSTLDVPIKFEPNDDQTDSQMLKQRLEMYWKGMVKYQQELRQEPNANSGSGRRAVEVEGATKLPPAQWKSNPPQQPLSNDHITNYLENNGAVKQEPLFFQRAMKAAITMQKTQQRRWNHGADLGGLLPPPPELIVSTSLPSTTSNSFFPSSSTVLAQIPHSSSGISTNPKHTVPNNLSPTSITHRDETKDCGNLGQASDMPLDLSLPTTGRKRLHDGIPKLNGNYSESKEKSGKDRKKVDEVSLASIMSNFPTLLNSSRAQARATQQAMLTAHIESSLSNHPVSAATGPFTSLYQKHDSGVPAANSSNAELVQGDLQPLQIQQWLLAAVSAQKMQQMALNHISMLQQQRQQVVSNSEPQRKRPKVIETATQPYVSHPSLPQSSVSQQQPIFPHPLNRRLPDSHHLLTGGSGNFLSASRSTPKATSPTHSPESNQSQSGKRYRRYAKPPYSYVSLITLSILSSRDKKLRLSQILKRISEMFPFFNGSYQGWRDSVRHNLSQNECFVKVLKNPYRPTAKGNFWTVNLNSIPHELLLRQNTLVSRYAQDSGYRYRKDLSEVFDLRTGALKISVPRHLLRDADDPTGSALSDDPAAVMEAILLEETSDDEMSDFKDKISPEVRQFTLEDLFSQSEDAEDDSLLSSARNRGRNKQSSHTMPQPPTLLPSSFAPPIYQASNPALTVGSARKSRAVDVQNFASLGVLPQVLLSQVSNHASQLPLALSNASPNPFAAAQTALLSKALAVTQLQGFDNLQKMLHTNPGLRKSPFRSENPIPTTVPEKPTTPPMLASTSPTPQMTATSPVVHSRDMDNHDQIVLSDASSKKNKRKGINPIRHTGNLESSLQDGHEDGPVSPRNSVPAMGLASASTPSRTESSEGDPGNPFCSPATSSSTKSQSRVSPRHDESSEFEENRISSQSVYGAQSGSNMPFQALQMFGTPSIQASKTA